MLLLLLNAGEGGGVLARTAGDRGELVSSSGECQRGSTGRALCMVCSKRKAGQHELATSAGINSDAERRVACRPLMLVSSTAAQTSVSSCPVVRHAGIGGKDAA